MCRQSHVPTRGFWGGGVLVDVWLLEEGLFLDVWLHHSSLCLPDHIVYTFSVCPQISLCLLLKEHMLLNFRTT